MSKIWKQLWIGLLLVVILASCAPTPTTAPPEPSPATLSPATPETPAATLQVSGAMASERAFTTEDLTALGLQESLYTNRDGESTTYTGVSIALLLNTVTPAADATTLVLVASDGYEAQVPLADALVCAECIVAFEADGSFRAVLPDFPGNVQVRDLVALQVLSAAEAQPEPPPTSEDTIPNDGPVTITDAAGRTVSLEQLPRRIVVVGRGPFMALHLLYMFPEGRTRLVGAESRSATPSDFLPYVQPDFLERIVGMAANPNAEQIATLEPDLVIIKSVALEQIGESLAQVNIPVVYLGLETPEQFFQDVTNLGALLGNPTRAQGIIAFYQARLERIEAGVADIPENERPRVLLLEHSDRSGEVAGRVPPLVWMQTIQVEAAGGVPVWREAVQVTDGWTVVNFEQIAAWDPDKIFMVISYQLDPQEVIDGFKADPQWRALSAVQNEELYAFPGDIFGWDTPEARWLLGVNWLATRLHPEVFADLDLETEIYTFFGELYDMERDVIDSAILSQVYLDVH